MISIIVVSLEAILVAMVAAVIVLHSVAWWRAPKGLALMPLHVVVIASATLCFLVVGVNLVDKAQWTWQTITMVIGELLLGAAMVIIGEFQRRRIFRQELHRLRKEAA